MREKASEIQELENYIEIYKEIIDRYMEIVDKLKTNIQALEKERDGMRANWYKSIKTIAKQRNELERVKRERDSYKCFFDDIVNRPDCNTCIKKDCEYRPKPGQITRFNCHLWEG